MYWASTCPTNRPFKSVFAWLNVVRCTVAQIASLARIVCSVAKPGDRIVEFGAGSGHLGILLAHLLPACHVVLVERNLFRANMARLRVAQAGLHNVELCAGDAQAYSHDAVQAMYGHPIRPPPPQRVDDDDDGTALNTASGKCHRHTLREPP